MMEHQRIAVLDFGGQYAHLISNRIRRHGVYSEILDNEVSAEELKQYKGIILSGGPDSVNAEDSPKCDPALFELGIPVLAICYGHQLMQHLLGGKVTKGSTMEYGFATLQNTSEVDFLKDIQTPSRVWMSHFDIVDENALAEGFEVVGTTNDCPTAIIANLEKDLYGIQFHAEVTHTDEGFNLLENFIKICEKKGAFKRDWTIEQFIEEEIDRIKEKIGDKKVFLLVSGGVDSTVCFALLEKALGKERVYGMLVDTGLMRYKEAEKVEKDLNEAGFTNLHVAKEERQFLSALSEVTDPEAKRKIIGDLFWKVKEDKAKELGLNPDAWIMGQGTIYPDTIESGGTKNADKIKTHHNRVDLMQEMIAAGKVIEPIAQLYKDEVRELGEKLGLPHHLVWRQPFPGPGLGVRILCASAEEIQKKPDFTDLNAKISFLIKQEFDVDMYVRVLPSQSVGVQGDERTYRFPVALFTSIRDWDQLEKISTALTNKFPEINRVILALKGDEEEFILHPYDINEERVQLLQKVDDQVTEIMKNAPEDYGIWQFPVVLLPTGVAPGRESIVLRPVASTEAMTATFARIDWKIIDQIIEKVGQDPFVGHVFYDLTHKPPGTIEWE